MVFWMSSTEKRETRREEAVLSHPFTVIGVGKRSDGWLD
jgi:hypothetical protein